MRLAIKRVYFSLKKRSAYKSAILVYFLRYMNHKYLTNNIVLKINIGKNIGINATHKNSDRAHPA